MTQQATPAIEPASQSPQPSRAVKPPLEPWVTKKVFLKRIRQTGTIKAGLQAAHITRPMLRVWLGCDRRFAQAYQDAQDHHFEATQERLNAAIRKGDGIALRFKLRGLAPEKYGDSWQRRQALPKAAASVSSPQGTNERQNDGLPDRWEPFEHHVDGL